MKGNNIVQKFKENKQACNEEECEMGHGCPDVAYFEVRGVGFSSPAIKVCRAHLSYLATVASKPVAKPKNNKNAKKDNQ